MQIAVAAGARIGIIRPMNSRPSRRLTAILGTFVALTFSHAPAHAQPVGYNYDEAKVGAYTLPDPLTLANGKPVTNAKTWQSKRRPEILKLFETQMHGRSPARPKDMQFEVTSTDKTALGGKATRKEITVRFGAEKDATQMHLLLYIPNGAKRFRVEATDTDGHVFQKEWKIENPGI